MCEVHDNATTLLLFKESQSEPSEKEDLYLPVSNYAFQALRFQGNVIRHATLEFLKKHPKIAYRAKTLATKFNFGPEQLSSI